MARLFDPQPIAPTSPFGWKTEKAQRRAHGLSTRATFAKLAPVRPAACTRCFCIHAGEC